MKRVFWLLTVFIFSPTGQAFANEPDFAHVFSYSSMQNNGKNGLHYARSVDRENWQGIRPEFRFLLSDFGTWGSQKRMLAPFLFQDQQGIWHTVWSLNEQVGQFTHAKTNDLYTWQPQSYPEVMTDGNVMMPEISLCTDKHNYLITWLSDQDENQQVFKTTTAYFKNYTPTVQGSETDRLNVREKVTIESNKQWGTISKIPWSLINRIIKFYELSKKYAENQEYITSSISLSDNKTDLKKRIASSFVHGSKTGDYILKMANLLPVVVNSKINLPDLPLIAREADLTLLKGELTDEKAKPQSSAIAVASEFEYSLRAYYLSGIKSKKSKQKNIVYLINDEPRKTKKHPLPEMGWLNGDSPNHIEFMCCNSIIRG